jgi:hypothetical protein
MCASIPSRAQADGFWRDLFLRFFHREPPSSAEESALAPGIGVLPPVQNLLSGLHSPRVKTRLQTIDTISRTGESSPQVLAALAQAAQDAHRDVSRRAVETLAGLCRSGHEEAVVRVLVRAANRSPRTVHTGYYFKIPDPDEERRVEQILENN